MMVTRTTRTMMNRPEVNADEGVCGVEGRNNSQARRRPTYVVRTSFEIASS